MYYYKIYIYQLLGVPEDELAVALTNKIIKVRGEVIRSCLDPKMSIFAKDALAKAIYSKLFDWLVTHINKTLKVKVYEDYGRANNNVSIGILDIYGFEILQTNG